MHPTHNIKAKAREDELRKELSKELDHLEDAVSDSNNTLMICSRERIWKFIDTIIDLATQAERERISENVSKLREEIINESWARNTNQYLSKKEVENALK